MDSNKNRLNFWLSSFGCICIIAMGIFLYPKLKSNFNESSLLDKSDLTYKNFQIYQSKFPQEERLLTIGFYQETGFYDFHDFLLIDSLVHQFEKINGISKLISITTVKLPLKTVVGTIQVPVLPLINTTNFKKHHNDLENYNDIREKFISSDNKALAVYIYLSDEANAEKIALELNQMLKQSSFHSQFVLFGADLSAAEITNHIRYDTLRLSIIGVVLLLSCLVILFANFSTIAIILLIVVCNVSVCYSVLYALNFPLTLLNTSLPLLVAILSITDCIHVVHYYSQLSPAIEFSDSKKLTYKNLRTALWLTSLTTLAGFAVFLFTSIDILFQYALCTCICIALSYLITILIFPNLLLLIPQDKNHTVKNIFEKKIIGLLTKRAKTISLISIICFIALAYYTVSHLTINHSIYTGQLKSSTTFQAANFYNTHFSGTRDIELIIKKNTPELNKQDVLLIDTLEHFLATNYRCKSIYSFNTILKRYNRFMHFNQSQYYRLPTQYDSTYFSSISNYKEHLGLNSVQSDDGYYLKIIGNLKDEGSYKANGLNQELIRFINQLETENSIFITGHSYVQDSALHQFCNTVMYGLLIGLASLLIIVSLVFRSLLWGVLVVITNVLPLLVVLFIMQICTIELNHFSIIVFTIAFGIAVDDTLHFIGNWKQLHSTRSAIKKEQLIIETFSRVYRPMIQTTIILIIGFSTLFFSVFQQNMTFAFLLIVALAFALLADLILLPAFILAFRTTK